MNICMYVCNIINTVFEIKDHYSQILPQNKNFFSKKLLIICLNFIVDVTLLIS